ncbi:MAG: hypothetical protein C0619_04395 [Desulfuromonas sp.]|nr:MAG: hypothetical protein C0619_04395 [Desulfuromonas sp.]
MSIFQFFFSFLKNLSIFCALIFGLNDYPFSIVLVLILFVVSLQFHQFRTFALDQITPGQNEMVTYFKKVIFFILPSVFLLSCSYLIGHSLHEYI